MQKYKFCSDDLIILFKLLWLTDKIFLNLTLKPSHLELIIVYSLLH